MSSHHHGDLKQALLDEALLSLRASSPEQLSLRALASQIGVSPMAPYRHFSNREEFLEELAANGFRESARKVADAEEPGLVAVARVWSDLANDCPGLFQLMSTPIGRRSRGSPLGDSIMEWLGEVVRVVERDGDEEDPAKLVTKAVSIWAAVHGLVILGSSGSLTPVDSWMHPDATELVALISRNA